MSRRFLFLLLAAGIGTGWAAADDRNGTRKATPPKSVAEQATRLVAELGSEDYEAREQAARQLEAIGPAAGPALLKAVAGHDPEVRRLALQIAERIARKAETAEVLEPHKIRLAWRDIPLHVAVADFQRATGVRIQLEGAKTDRKITLDTGYTNFWDAFDKFCTAAGLAEKVFDTASNDGQVELYPGQWGRRRMMIWNGGRWSPQQDDIIPALTNGQFVLVEGKSAARSSYQAGALRFRTLPAGTSMGRVSTLKGDKEFIFGLEILPEPALAWEKVQSLHIDKAIDEHGQNLQVTQAVPGETPNSEYDMSSTQNNNGGQRVPLRLTVGRKPSTVLKELSGVATIKMQTATQSIATIDRIMDARDKGAKGSDGSFIKVAEVKREEGNKLRIRVRVDQAADESAANNPWGWGWRGMGLRGTNDGNVDNTVSTGSLVLFDGRGHLVRLVAKEQIQDPNGQLEEYDFVYQLVKGQPEPDKLVLQGRRPVSIDVPFTLRDVPLKAAPGAPKPAPPPMRTGPVPDGIGVEW
jgi:hypothetical protein